MGHPDDGAGAKTRCRKARANWIALKPDAQGLCELIEAICAMVSGNVPTSSTSWRAQTLRRFARGADPLPPLRPQTDRALYRRPA